MNNPELIQALKDNKSAFGLMPELMQAKMREIGRSECVMYMKNEKWVRCGDENDHDFSQMIVNDQTYRLRPDYKQEQADREDFEDKMEEKYHPY